MFKEAANVGAEVAAVSKRHPQKRPPPILTQNGWDWFFSKFIPSRFGGWSGHHSLDQLDLQPVNVQQVNLKLLNLKLLNLQLVDVQLVDVQLVDVIG